VSAQQADVPVSDAGIAAAVRTEPERHGPRLELPGWLMVAIPALAELLAGGYRIAGPSLWRDEGYTIVGSQRPVGAIWAMIQHQDAVHAPYYLLMHFVIAAGGSSETTLRLPSLIAMCLAAGLTAVVGRRLAAASGLRAPAATGLLAGLLLVAVPLTTRYAQEARTYGLTMLFAVLATYLLIRAASSRRWSWWAGYALAIALVGMFSILAVLLAAAHGISLVLARRASPGLVTSVPGRGGVPAGDPDLRGLAGTGAGGGGAGRGRADSAGTDLGRTDLGGTDLGRAQSGGPASHAAASGGPGSDSAAGGGPGGGGAASDGVSSRAGSDSAGSDSAASDGVSRSAGGGGAAPSAAAGGGAGSDSAASGGVSRSASRGSAARSAAASSGPGGGGAASDGVSWSAGGGGAESRGTGTSGAEVGAVHRVDANIRVDASGRADFDADLGGANHDRTRAAVVTEGAVTRWMVACGAAAVLLAPMIIFAVAQASQENWITTPDLSTVATLVRDFAGTTLLIPVIGLLAVLGCVAGSGLRRGSGLTVAVVTVPWLVLPPVLLLAVSLAHPLYVERYVVFCLPALSVLSAAGLTSLVEPTRSALAERGISGSRSAAALAVGPSVVLAVIVVAALIGPQRAIRQTTARVDDLRAVAATVAANERPGDAIVYLPWDTRPIGMAYPGPFLKLRDVELGSSPIASATLRGVEASASLVAARLRGVRRVWTVQWAQQPSPGGPTPTEAAAAAAIKGMRLIERWHIASVVLSLYAAR